MTRILISFFVYLVPLVPFSLTVSVLYITFVHGSDGNL